jgi:hypothetical protein
MLSLCLNIFISTKTLLKIVVNIWSDDFEKLFHNCMVNNKLLMLTLESGKVYICYINRISKPLITQQIEIIPYMSGYRNSEDKILHLTTSYVDLIKGYIDNEKTNEIIDDIGIVLPKDKIISASKFNLDVFKGFATV